MDEVDHRRGMLRVLALAVMLMIPMYAAADENSGWLWPVASGYRHISRGFFVDSPDGGTHEAIDIPVGIGHELYASKDGIVAVVYNGCQRSFPNGSLESCSPATCSPEAVFYHWETGETGRESGLFHHFTHCDEDGKPISSYSRCNFGYGCGVIIYHPQDHVITSYAHMDSVDVRAGQAVQQGQVIGRSGARGNSFGAHLHFQIGLNPCPGTPWPTDSWKNNNPVSPSLLITAGNTTALSIANGYAYHPEGVEYLFEIPEKP